MSQVYDLVCTDCRVRWSAVGQTGRGGRYFYSDNEVFRFLQDHQDHRVRVFSELDEDEDIEANYSVVHGGEGVRQEEESDDIRLDITSPLTERALRVFAQDCEGTNLELAANLNARLDTLHGPLKGTDREDIASLGREVQTVDYVAPIAAPIGFGLIALLIGRRFRDKRDDTVWTIHKSEGFLPEQIVTIKTDPKTTKGPGGSAEGRRFKANWSMDLTMEMLNDYAKHAEWLSTEVFVVACRPFPEKVIGGKVSTREGASYEVDGTFTLDEVQAHSIAEDLNEAHGGDSWKVYPAHLQVAREAKS